MTLEQIIDLFQARKSGSKWKALCPAHDDHDPSLDIVVGRNGKILLYCQSQHCALPKICAAKGITINDLNPGVTSKPKVTDAKPEVTVTPVVVGYHYYHDKDGEVIYRIVRQDPKSAGFPVETPDGNGGWRRGLHGVQPVLFNLPEVLKADTVLICEGERDCETAAKYGIVATTNTFGAGKWHDDYSDDLKGKRCVIMPDHVPNSNDPGMKHGEQVAASLQGRAREVAFFVAPGGFKDLSAWEEDWSFSKADLDELIKNAPACTPDSFKEEVQFLDLFHTPEECKNVPEITFSIGEFLQNDGMTFIGGLSGHGKTWLMLSIVKALLTGGKLWDTFPVNQIAKRIVYLIPEVGLSSFMWRVKRMGLQPFIDDRRLLIRTLSKGPTPELDDPKMLAAVKGAHVILDTAARFATGEENSSGDNARGLATDIFTLLRAGALTVICAHHSPKGFLKETVMSLEGILRGTGDIGAMATTVWGCKQLDESQNIVYLECVKARDFNHCQPFQLRGRPCIDREGDFALHLAPGVSGMLIDEQPNPINRDRKHGRDANVDLVRKWLAADPNVSTAEIVAKFLDCGKNVSEITVRKYKSTLRKESGWGQSTFTDGKDVVQ